MQRFELLEVPLQCKRKAGFVAAAAALVGAPAHLRAYGARGVVALQHLHGCDLQQREIVVVVLPAGEVARTRQHRRWPLHRPHRRRHFTVWKHAMQ